MSMDTIRTKVKQEIVGRGEKQREVAEALKIPPQYLSEMLNTDKGGLSKRWQELLEYLDLELTVKPKTTSADNQKPMDERILEAGSSSPLAPLASRAELRNQQAPLAISSAELIRQMRDEVR